MRNKACLALLPFCLLLTCCKERSKKTNSPIIFSEIHIGTNVGNWAVELANTSSKTVDLSKYSIDIYQGSSKTRKVNIPLQGNVEPNSTYTICYEEASQEIKDKSNFVSPLLYIDGTYPLVLTKSNKKMDVLGVVGYRYDYASSRSLVRKSNYMIGRLEYDEYDWLRHSEDNCKYLGNLDNSVSEGELLEGPHLTKEDFERPFAIDGSIAGGGAIKVDLAYTGDGDTTNFYIPYNEQKYGISSRESIRYMCINTPEIAHGYGEVSDPWGDKAKEFNNKIINSSKSFAISTSTGYYLRETYGRIMGYVWVSDKLNPEPEDYTLLNFLMIKEGYSTLRFLDGKENNDPMFYKDIRYTSYMRNAEIVAQRAGLKVHGQLDPDFNY